MTWRLVLSNMTKEEGRGRRAGRWSPVAPRPKVRPRFAQSAGKGSSSWSEVMLDWSDTRLICFWCYQGVFLSFLFVLIIREFNYVCYIPWFWNSLFILLLDIWWLKMIFRFVFQIISKWKNMKLNISSLINLKWTNTGIIYKWK